ncbi:MAG: hypothetical protein JO190_02565 [Candidatus Eremiobacteraeota bacterium]|nr:hypothetical protein [Candidatus Eremiobacteraeota bacterium]MBV8498717.1 hypothetical protein [Candidatus Eremiobacteraeota bacterium]
MVKTPVRSIVAAIADAAARWSDAGFGARLRARDAVSARTGYSPTTVEYAFDRLFESLRADAIEAIIADELESPEALDRFVSRAGRPRARAVPIGRVCVISSRTTVGVAIVPAVFALCAKCDVLVKDREDHLVSAFFATLARELPELRSSAVAMPWESAGEALELDGFAAVVAFGDDATLALIAARLPYSARFIPYGSRASAGYVTREALNEPSAAHEIARRAATDLLLYETEGCLSLHTLFVERGGAVSPQRFAEMLADAIPVCANELGAGRPDARRGARLAMARDIAAFRAARGATLTDPGSTYLLLVDPEWDEPPAFISRALPIRSVDEPAAAAAYFRRHGIGIEALAVADARRDVADAALSMGAARIARLGGLQAPALGDFHGGRPRIAEFVRWVSDET